MQNCNSQSWLNRSSFKLLVTTVLLLLLFQAHAQSTLDKLNLPSSDNWSHQERENIKTVLAFLDGTIGGDPERMMGLFGDYPYKQHNRSVEDGIPGAVKALKTYKKNYPDMEVAVKNMYVDGAYVITHSHMTLKKKHRGDDGKGFNVIDIWKVVDGKIVEHWDAVQPIHGAMRFFSWVGGGKVKNQNGVF